MNTQTVSGVPRSISVFLFHPFLSLCSSLSFKSEVAAAASAGCFCECGCDLLSLPHSLTVSFLCSLQGQHLLGYLPLATWWDGQDDCSRLSSITEFQDDHRLHTAPVTIWLPSIPGVGFFWGSWCYYSFCEIRVFVFSANFFPLWVHILLCFP